MDSASPTVYNNHHIKARHSRRIPLSVCLPVNLSLSLSCLSVCIWLSVSPAISLSVYFSVYMPQPVYHSSILSFSSLCLYICVYYLNDMEVKGYLHVLCVDIPFHSYHSNNNVGHDGALVEAITLNRRVVGSTPAL